MKGIDSYWPEWTSRGACATTGTEGFFPGTAEDDWDTPKRVCINHCPVRPQCLDAAMASELGLGHKSRYGIVGGLSPVERHAFEPAWLVEQAGGAA
jgi:hypothetical protein